jgi:hypothetical protein
MTTNIAAIFVVNFTQLLLAADELSSFDLHEVSIGAGLYHAQRSSTMDD